MIKRSAILLASALLCIRIDAAEPLVERPNVVLILTDDLGWADLGCYGAPDIKTPHIDTLARDGVKFPEFYSNGVLCTPTRAALISGRYQQRYGIEAAFSGASSADGRRGLPARGHSLPQLLKDRGYATALIGKWHLGYQPEFSPAAHGFDYFFGLKSGYHDFYAHTAGDGKPDLYENERAVEVPGYTTDLLTDRAVKYIEQHAGGRFFVEVAYNAPHWPYQPPDRPSVAPGNARHVMPHEPGAGTRADYVAMVERVDRGVGDILRALDRHGLRRNTIVIFTNDNGGEWLSHNGPLFHRKWTVWEGGIRVPALIRWPERLSGGTVSTQVGATFDLHASIVAATGAQPATDAGLEGINLFPILEGKSPELRRTLFWRTAAGNRTQRAVRSGDWKVVVDGNHTMVFNVRADPGERTDLASRRQDIATELHSLLTDWERAVDVEAKKHAAASTSEQPTTPAAAATSRQ